MLLLTSTTIGMHLQQQQQPRKIIIFVLNFALIFLQSRYAFRKCFGAR